MKPVAMTAMLIAAEITFTLPFFVSQPAGTAQAIARCTEDSACWDCTQDGNRICGPDNAQLATAGCYSRSGVLVTPWPCTAILNPDGTTDIYPGN